MINVLPAINILVTMLLAADPAMEPPRINVAPGREYSDAYRRFQGIPCIERAKNGRLWAAWYSGDIREGPRNYVVLTTSGDDGKTWSGPRMVIDPDGFVRAFDACLWMDPQQRLWLFWGQAAGHWDGRAGIWASMTTDPSSSQPSWSAPRRIADGILMNKPIVRTNGDWLLPVTLWTREPNLPFINERDRLNLSPEGLRSLIHDPPHARGSHTLVSTDRGKTFRALPIAPFPPEDGPTENMLIERRDNSLWMLARTRYGIGESESNDGGQTWSPARPSNIQHPPTRFFITRLRSGKLLLVKHAPPNGKARSHLTAMLSADDGRTWTGSLLLDERMNVSYPDGVQGPDGRIFVIYDRERFSEREILMSVFREEDIVAGKGASRLTVNKAGGTTAPQLSGSGWRQLGIEDWQGRDGKPHKWYAAPDVYIKPLKPRDLLLPVGEPGRGPVMANGDDGRTLDFVSKETFGDIELYLEFLVTAKSNSGVYLQGLYEVQILDSYGSPAPPGVHDSGALYERWINNRGVGGTAPLKNVSLPPGEWQSFRIWFRAPRFDSAGKKTEPARVVRLDHNGVTVQRDVILPGPTRASLEIPEAPINPLMIQGDHGPVALRNIYIRKTSF
jgi:predicted neuraminidase